MESLYENISNKLTETFSGYSEKDRQALIALDKEPILNYLKQISGTNDITIKWSNPPKTSDYYCMEFVTGDIKSSCGIVGLLCNKIILKGEFGIDDGYNYYNPNVYYGMITLELFRRYADVDSVDIAEVKYANGKWEFEQIY